MCKSAALLAAEVAGSGACRRMDEKHDTIHTERKTWREAPTNLLLCTHDIVADACLDSCFQLFCVCVCGYRFRALSSHRGVILNCC